MRSLPSRFEEKDAETLERQGLGYIKESKYSAGKVYGGAVQRSGKSFFSLTPTASSSVCLEQSARQLRGVIFFFVLFSRRRDCEQ